MAELVLSALLPVLFEKLMSAELLKFATREGVRSTLKKWAKTLKMIEALLCDAEEKQLTNRAVKMWLEDLQELAYELEDILDEYATEALRRKLKIEDHQASTSRVRKLFPDRCIGFTTSALCPNLSVRSKIDDITCRLEDLCKKRTELGLTDSAGERSTAAWKRPKTSSLQTEPAVYGRDEDKAKILEMVLADERGNANFGVVSIVGMGGLGKTTLAREVYNDNAVKDFSPKAWVCISDDFDVMRISTAILESITDSASDLKNLDAVQNRLKEKVDGRKFLLVLDDVWSEDYSKWELLRSPFMVGACGSKIIVTTRHERVALTMGRSNECHRLMLLSDDDCWSLFKKHVFDEEFVSEQTCKLIRQKVIEKCKGLPLVVKTLAGLLRSENRENWSNILNSKLWDLLQDGSEIPAALQISYYHLPSHLKRCFTYCAILPKDYEFEKKELVFLWMAEGLIQQSSDNEQLEDLGGKYFCELLLRSIFQTSSSSSLKFVMHDLINDLAQKISREQSFRLEDDLEYNNQSISERTRYASYICHEFIDKGKFKAFNNAMHLRTHFSMPRLNALMETTCYVSHTVVFDLLSRFKKLRVLSLQNYCFGELPNSIGCLRLLRYLNLSASEIRSLPESINSMCNLQTLILRNCCKFSKWPCRMGNLVNLRHLDLFGASLVGEMPIGIENWKSLRTLSNFIVGKNSRSSLKDLKHLKFLCGELCISRLENVSNFDGTTEFILSDKKDLKVLSLEWGSSLDELKDEEVLKMLRPHHDLEELTIRHYRGTKFSSWVGNHSFSKMTVIKLEDCKKCTILPSLGLLTSLKNLSIEGMEGIIEIGSKFYGEHCSNPFKSLETLCFKDLKEWKHWSPMKENESFPKLEEIFIVNCPKLNERLPNNPSSLKKLVIRGCKQLVVSLSNIPMLCELELDECKEIVCSSSTFSKSLESMTLSNIPNFVNWSRQELKKVKSLEINGCEELIELWQNEIFLGKPPQGVHSFISLKELDFKNCNTLTTLFEGIQLKNANVEKMRIESCDSLNFIFRGQLPQSLKELHIRNCEKLRSLFCTSSSSTIMQFLKKFPFLAILFPKERVNVNTSHLEYLNIENCPSLMNLPSINHHSTTLTRLSIQRCSSLTTLSLTDHLPVALKHLEIADCSELTTLLPKGQLPETLETLNIHCCLKLESIVEKFHNNKALYSISISRCKNLKSLPGGLETLSSFASFPKEGFPNSNLSVELIDCSELEALPKGIHTLSSLKISGCPKLSLFGDGPPTELELLEIEGLEQYKGVMEWGMDNLISLTDLGISGRPDFEFWQKRNLSSPTDLSTSGRQEGESWGITSLTDLIFGRPDVEFWRMGNLSSPTDVSISERLEEESWGCPYRKLFLEEDFKITLPLSLTKLRIIEFPKLKCLPFKNFKDLSSLKCLRITDCPELTSLPSLPSSLLQLEIICCPRLKEACKRDNGTEWSKITDIPCVKIDGKFVHDPEEEAS